VANICHLVDICHVVGTDHFYKYWPLVRFPPNVGRCDTTQITIVYLSSETFNCEHICLPYKPVVETLRQVLAWLLLQCRITGAFIRCAYRGDVAFEKLDDYPLRIFMDIYRTKFCMKFLGHLSFPLSAICLAYEVSLLQGRAEMPLHSYHLNANWLKRM
jgi:hypothetical protein